MNADTRFYHGTRATLDPGTLIDPSPTPSGSPVGTTSYVYLTTTVDEAIWDAELAVGQDPARVYLVEPLGPVEDAPDRKSPHPSMSSRSHHPVRVRGETTEWPLYHGTRGDLKAGDLIQPGCTPNFGNRARTTKWVYCTRTLDAAAWGAELAEGGAPGRIYVVEPTGPIEDDPNLTDKKYRGNPTKAFRSPDPLKVTSEVLGWTGHPPEAIRAMKDGLERLSRLGAVIIEE